MPYLEPEPPRTYPLRECFRGRVWRSPGGVMGMDALVAGVAFAMLGVMRSRDDFIAWGLLLAAVGAVAGAVAHVWINARRAALIRVGPTVEGVVERPRRVFALHEMFRGKRERTFVVPYRYTAPDGKARRGRAWVCGCVLERLPVGSIERIAVHPRNPGRSLLLRLAVMVARTERGRFSGAGAAARPARHRPSRR